MSSMLLLLSVAALSAEVAPTGVVADRPALVAADSLAEVQRKLALALEQQRPEETLIYAKALIAHPDFGALSEPRQRAAHYLAGLLNLQLERPEAAVPYLVVATEGPEAGLEQWLFRVQAHSGARDMNGAARALTTMLGRYPETLDEVNDTYITSLARNEHVEDDVVFELRLALLRSNWDYEWASWTWMELISDLIERDRAAEAQAIVARVTTPDARLQLFAMRRYDAVRPAGATLDLAPLYDLALTSQRKVAEKPDATFKTLSSYAGSLLSHGRYDEALRVVEDALARPEPVADSEDASDLTWIMDTRSRVLMALGRRDEALVQLQTAAARQEFGQPNVSQTINLGWLYLRLGRFDDALQAVSVISKDGVSSFGWMQAVQVRACAAYGLGDTALGETELAWLTEHWKDAPGATYDALACKGDEDAMAALMLSRLNDPELADDAVSAMHDYLPPASPTEFDSRLNMHSVRVLARPDVIAARDAVGRAYVVPTVGLLF